VGGARLAQPQDAEARAAADGRVGEVQLEPALGEVRIPGKAVMVVLVQLAAGQHVDEQAVA
jgi:hypothetical protein